MSKRAAAAKQKNTEATQGCGHEMNEWFKAVKERERKKKTGMAVYQRLTWRKRAAVVLVAAAAWRWGFCVMHDGGRNLLFDWDFYQVFTTERDNYCMRHKAKLGMKLESVFFFYLPLGTKLKLRLQSFVISIICLLLMVYVCLVSRMVVIRVSQIHTLVRSINSTLN